MERIGQIKKLMRYPVKSMAGVSEGEIRLGWHGLAGDRRIAVRQVGHSGDFPWLTASKLPELLLYQAANFELNSPEQLPTQVINLDGQSFDIESDELRLDLSRRAGRDVELMALKHGIFDDSVVSMIASQTISRICNDAGVAVDSRRFRANIELDCHDAPSFIEDNWLSGTIEFGEPARGPAIFVAKRDERCKMIGLDPGSGEHNPDVVKTAVRLNDNYAGVYCSVIRPGTLRVEDEVFLTPAN